MKLIHAIVFVALIYNSISAQQINIRINGISEKRGYISFLEGEKSTLIDSVSSNGNNEFKFGIDENKFHTGFYRLYFKNGKIIDFIYDGNNIKLETNADNIVDSILVKESETNKLYYQFIKLNKEYKTKTELLQLILSRYPKGDDFYKTAQDKFQQLQREYWEFVNITSQNNPDSFISRYIKSSQLPVVDFNLLLDKQLSFLKSHALDNIDFDDNELVYSDAFTNKTIEYLTYYRNPQLPKELLEKEFEKAIDSVLVRAKININVYRHIVEYLIDGFKKFGFDEVLDYLVGNYVIKDDLCLSAQTESLIIRRIEQAKRFKDSSLVPNIIMKDALGNTFDLANVKTDKVLILFYASWCPHCQELIPQLNELYKQQKEKRIEVFAISIDTNKSEWINFIRENNLNWINVSDLNGWESKAALDYFIYATPTMFVVNRNKRIIDKQLTIDDLKKYFKN